MGANLSQPEFACARPEFCTVWRSNARRQFHNIAKQSLCRAEP
jgi:hypothetical protein